MSWIPEIDEECEEEIICQLDKNRLLAAENRKLNQYNQKLAQKIE